MASLKIHDHSFCLCSKSLKMQNSLKQMDLIFHLLGCHICVYKKPICLARGLCYNVHYATSIICHLLGKCPNRPIILTSIWKLLCSLYPSMVVSIASWERRSLPPCLCFVRNGDSPNFIKQRLFSKRLTLSWGAWKQTLLMSLITSKQCT